MRNDDRPPSAIPGVLADARGVTSAEYAIMAVVIIIAVGSFTTAVDNPLRTALGAVGTRATEVMNGIIAGGGGSGGGTR